MECSVRTAIQLLSLPCNNRRQESCSGSAYLPVQQHREHDTGVSHLRTENRACTQQRMEDSCRRVYTGVYRHVRAHVRLLKRALRRRLGRCGHVGRDALEQPTGRVADPRQLQLERLVLVVHAVQAVHTHQTPKDSGTAPWLPT